jgi:hypothetical protein
LINGMLVNPGQLASFGFFVYCAAIGYSLDRRRRNQVVLRSLGGAIVTGVWVASGPAGVLHDWLLPPIVLLGAYWTSGALFTMPSQPAEGRLMAIDRALGVAGIAAGAPRLVAEALEVAYIWVYPLIPVALAIHLVATPHPDVNRFWAVILITDYICFGTLPWVQTRPPRKLEARDPWQSSVRRINVRLLGATSIGVNTFPSGHAAEALAAALLSTGAPAPIVVLMFASAAAISAGAVLGRYHYAADAVAGWLVALVVWALL